MSTTKPRITITLEKNSHTILQRLSELGGQSMSAIVTDFLDIGLPSMERMVVVLEQAKRAPGQTREGVLAAINRAEQAILPALVSALEQPDMFLVDAVGGPVGPPAVSGAAKRPRAAVAAPKTPVLVTRGSGRAKAPRQGLSASTVQVPAKGGKRGSL